MLKCFDQQKTIEMLDDTLAEISTYSILDPRNSKLEPQNSILETRSSILENIEDRVLSQDCQLTFDRYCTLGRDISAIRYRHVDWHSADTRPSIGQHVGWYVGR